MNKFLQQFPKQAIPVNWFPGHMNKGIQLFGKNTSEIDFYI